MPRNSMCWVGLSKPWNLESLKVIPREVARERRVVWVN